VPLAEAVGERGRVVGVDLSEPMLAGARQRVAESRLGNISLTQADAQVHRCEAGRFDLIASRFGVMFSLIPSPRSAISCPRRALAAACALSVGGRSRRTGTG